MQEKVNGLDLNVTAAEGAAHVRVCMGEQLVLDTDALSVQGLHNLSETLKRAAKLAEEELGLYWWRQQEQIRRERAADAS